MYRLLNVNQKQFIFWIFINHLFAHVKDYSIISKKPKQD